MDTPTTTDKPKNEDRLLTLFGEDTGIELTGPVEETSPEPIQPEKSISEPTQPSLQPSPMLDGGNTVPAAHPESSHPLPGGSEYEKELAQKLQQATEDRLRLEGQVEVLKQSAPKPEVSAPAEPEIIPFVSDEEFKQLALLDSPQAINAALNKLYRRTREDAIRSVPGMVAEEVRRQQTEYQKMQQNAVQWQRRTSDLVQGMNEEQRGAFTNYVRARAEGLAKDQPELLKTPSAFQDVLEKEVRTIMNRPKPVSPAPPTGVTPSATPAPPAEPRQVQRPPVFASSQARQQAADTRPDQTKKLEAMFA